MKHFIQRYESGQIFWSRNFKSRQKSTMNIPAPIARIAATAVPRNNNTLFMARSKLFRKNLINNTYSRSIGHGLFTSMEILPNQRIIQFNGEVISVQPGDKEFMSYNYLILTILIVIKLDGTNC